MEEVETNLPKEPVESIVRPESPLGTILSTDAEEDGTPPGVGVAQSFGSFDTNDALPLPTISDNPVAKTVTTERKHELLLMAREDRRQWIYQIPLPYRSVPSGLTPLETFLDKSHASRYLPSAKLILSHLYGQSQAAADALLNEDTNGASTLYMSGQQILKHELDKADGEKVTILEKYQAFLKYLEDTGSLVQGLRSFCRNYNAPDNDGDLQTAIVQLQTYIQATSKSVDDKASFESFIFGHCRPAIEKLVKVEGENSFKLKVQSLQFIESKHLDITINETLLPLEALRSVDAYHSIYEKLQRILQVFHGVNEALKSADAEILPSADDVLPGVIFTVLRAQPTNLLWNLKFIEEWSPPEYLRGEAGYAFTNLFGAVQFLQDLKDPSSLSISQEDFAANIAASRNVIEERQNKIVGIPKIDVLEEEKQEEARFPTARDIREARKKGGVIDIEWALSWQKGVPATAEEQPVASITERRHYSFLASTPDEIRMKDLPILLEEYRDLFEMSERLRTEKATESARARRKQTEVAEQDLIDVARSLNLL